jgi:hypothetical protein
MGRPHTYLDAEAAAAEIGRRVASQPIVYYGESLGGAVCTEPRRHLPVRHP